MLIKFLWAVYILLKNLVCHMYGKKIIVVTLHRLAILLGGIHIVARHLAII